MQVIRSAVVDAPLSRVWEILRDFNSHAAWHPNVTASEIEGERAGDEVGCVRWFRLNDGSELREQLLKLSDHETTFTYAIIDSPIPLRDYVATLTLRPVTDGNATFIDWRSRFRVPRGRESDLADLVGKQVYEAGIRGLRDFLHQSDPSAAEVKEGRRAPQPVIKDEAIPAQAVMIDQPGGPEVMTLRDIVVPAPQAGEVRIRQTAIGVNFFDTYQRSGQRPVASYPATLGVEAAGVVEDIGLGVIGVYPGDRVVYAQLPAGSYATLRNIPASWCVPIPNGISDEIAASSLLKGVTAEFILHHVAPIKAGDVILVHSAAGGLGSILTQWAKARGANVLGTVSTEGKAKRVRDLGCDWPIDRSQTDFADHVLDLTKGRGADVIVDGIGAATLNGSVKALARFGRLVSVGASSAPVSTLDIDGLTEKSASFARPVYFHYASDPARLRAMAARFFTMVEQARIRITFSNQYDLQNVAQAHKDIEAGQTSGSLLLRPAT